MTRRKRNNGGNAEKEKLEKYIHKRVSKVGRNNDKNMERIIHLQNYRHIALGGVVYKIIAVVIKNRLNDVAEKRIGQYRCGFRKNRSVMYQI